MNTAGFRASDIRAAAVREAGEASSLILVGFMGSLALAGLFNQRPCANGVSTRTLGWSPEWTTIEIPSSMRRSTARWHEPPATSRIGYDSGRSVGGIVQYDDNGQRLGQSRLLSQGAQQSR